MDLVPRPDMDVALPVEQHLLNGCCLEAQRAENVALQLEGLRNALADASSAPLTLIIEEVHNSARFLRELADLSQMHQDRVAIVLNHLNVVLPCLSRTLRDITTYYEDRSMTKKNRWRNMYHQMKDETDGVSLHQRFLVYNYFLTSLRDVLVRSVWPPRSATAPRLKTRL